MNLAIMQPYLFPYTGYFQLVASVDRFVFYDDVNYIKNGWINRNRWLCSGEPHYFTLPLDRASSFRKISEIEVQPRAQWLRKMLDALHHGYARAPHYPRVRELIGDVLGGEETHVAAIAARSVIEVARYLGLDTEFVPGSACYANADLHGQTRVLDICRQEHAKSYTNLPGGRSLYDADAFAGQGIELRFIEPDLSPYRQFGQSFVPGLSILDAMMFRDPQHLRETFLEPALS